MTEVTIVGGGLAGCECAWQLAERGHSVTLYEQKPHARTPAQTGDGLAELVCSNSFRGAALSNAVGLLKEEMLRAGSLVMNVGNEVRVPAGGAFAVDRERFSETMTSRVEAHPRIRIVREVVAAIPEAPVVVLATGPLTGTELAEDLARSVGSDHLAYYDAIAPILSADSIDENITFRASRYDKGDDDAYINCPFDKEQYLRFVKAMVEAEKVAPREFEKIKYFEGCLPVEVMAERGERTLAFGPMKPVGLTNPRTGRWPYAVVQLRPEDVDRSAYNMVGFQTRMKYPEQKRVFSLIPGLENVEFLRYGSVHRNTFVNSPVVLGDRFELRNRPEVFLAGQITGVEGYVESAACGMMLGWMLCDIELPPPTTALHSLYRHLRTVPEGKLKFQPSNVVFSMFPSLETTRRLGKKERAEAQAERALRDLSEWLMRVDAGQVRARLEQRSPAEITAEVHA